MTERADVIARFLDTAGWGRAERRLLAADASFRSYDRLQEGKRRAVLMNAPPPQENVAAFHRVQDILLGLGLSAPKTFAIDEPNGLLLLEDFGDRTFTRALAAGTDEGRLYRMATEVLTALHKRCRTEADSLKPYDAGELEREALLLPEWYFPAVTGREVTDDQRARYLEAWRQLWPRALKAPANLVLRDYHVDNLMVLDGRAGVAACGLLDFQDALKGPVSYDLASLLQDARRDVPEDLEADMIALYLAAFPDLDPTAFRASYDVLAAQRSAKIIGIFTRLSRRDGKDVYLKHIPRVWRLLSRALALPGLAPVADWFRRELPEELRQVPPPRAAKAGK